MQSSKSIAKSLVRALDNGADPKKLADILADKILASSQSAQLEHILFYLEVQAKRLKDERSLRVESATEMSDLELSKITKFFGAKDKNSTEVRIDPKLIAGFRVRHYDYLYDATLSTRLNKLKEALI